MANLSDLRADPELSAAVFGSAPLATVAGRFPSRADLMRFYAAALAASHPPAQDRGCALCRAHGPTAGDYVLHWRGTVALYWVRIVLFSTVFLPLVVFMLLMPVGILPLPKLRFGQEVAFVTSHPACPACWRRQRVRQAVAFTVQVVAGLVLAVGFLTAAITGSIAAACLLQAWDYKPGDAGGVGLVCGGSVAACVVAKVVIDRVPTRVLVPPALRHLAKPPFGLSDAKLVRRRAAAGV